MNHTSRLVHMYQWPGPGLGSGLGEGLVLKEGCTEREQGYG